MIEEDETTVIYPLLAWRVGLAETKASLVEVVFARNLEEAQEGMRGGDLPGVPLGVTAHQCRELAADLQGVLRPLLGG